MRNLRNKITLIVMSVFLAFSQVACGGDKIEKSVAVFTRSVKAAREVTTEQYEYKYITAEQYKERLLLFKNVYIATDVLGDKLVEFGEINATNKLEALRLVREVNAALVALIANGNLGVTNEQSKARFNAVLFTATATISSIEVVIAALKEPINTENLKIEPAPVSNE